jgi:hypothetical protein
MKPAKFEQKGDIGTIQFNARWKLRTAQGTYIYRGDISADPIKARQHLIIITIIIMTIID